MKKDSIHQQFYLEILSKIKSGEWKKGDKIPAERTLCGLYNISRTTVREALKNLENEGYVVRKRGSGSFVNIKPIKQELAKLYTLREMFIEQGIKHDVRILEFENEQGNEEICKMLNIEAGERVYKINRVFFAASIPYTVEYTYLPYSSVPDITREMVENDGLYASLERLDKKPTDAEEIIRAIEITERQKELLELDDVSFAIETKRVARSNNTIIEYTVNITRNDYFVYTVKLG
ncbi:MAG: GntR family transcriptional regulator [Firmicutes bacterium HGW-Firmicutes-7]|nr:MAG: GntR family transcriptional regulator [Firmicutes bacterium HGW-Firmicutes-7]